MLERRLLKVKIGEIAGPHPKALELTPELAGCLHSWCIHDFSESSVDSLLMLHPLVVQQNEKKGYRVVAGFRSYQLAIAHLKPEQAIRVCVVSGLDGDEIRQLAIIDILGSPLLLGLGSKPQKQIERLCEAFNHSRLDEIHPDLNSSRGIKRLLQGRSDA